MICTRFHLVINFRQSNNYTAACKILKSNSTIYVLSSTNMFPGITWDKMVDNWVQLQTHLFINLKGILETILRPCNLSIKSYNEVVLYLDWLLNTFAEIPFFSDLKIAFFFSSSFSFRQACYLSQTNYRPLFASWQFVVSFFVTENTL